MLWWGLVSLLSLFLLMCGLLECPSILGVWVLLELLTLGGVCLFFINGFQSVNFSSLFYYIVGAGYSSFLVVAGVLINPWFNLLLIISVILKLGVFPFTGWLYRVVSGSNWSLVWFFSSPLKISFVLVVFGLGVSDSLCSLVWLLVNISFVASIINFLGITRSWSYLWCHMLVSSGSGLLIIVFQEGLFWSLIVYFSFLVWSSLAILYFSFYSNARVSKGWDVFLFFFVLVTFPGSLAMLYKLVVALSLVGSSFFVLVFWGFYSIVEQGYLINKVLEGSVGGSGMYVSLV